MIIFVRMQFTLKMVSSFFKINFIIIIIVIIIIIIICRQCDAMVSSNDVIASRFYFFTKMTFFIHFLNVESFSSMFVIVNWELLLLVSIERPVAGFQQHDEPYNS